jgi:hypothetical protein
MSSFDIAALLVIAWLAAQTLLRLYKIVTRLPRRED